MQKEIYALGIGHSTPVFIEIAEACGYTIKGLYHYNSERTGEYDHDYQIIGSFDDLMTSDLSGKNFLLTMGDIQIKKQMFEKIIEKGGRIPTLIHPTVLVSKFCHISNSGVVIGPLVEIQSDVNIHQNVSIWAGALICHCSEVREHCFIGPKALVGAYLLIERESFVGQASVLVSGKANIIGSGAIIGAGSIVTKSVESNVVVAGNPARVLKRLDEKQ